VSRHDPRALHALARHRGVQRRYTTADGRRVAVSDTTLVRVLRALGVELSGPDSVAAAWRACREIDEASWQPALDMDAEVGECDYLPAGWPPETRCVVRRVRVRETS